MPVMPKGNTPYVSHSTVTVLNPVIGGAKYVPLKRAMQWVRQGLAEWADMTCYRIRLGAELRLDMADFHTRPARDAAIGYDGVFVLRDSARPRMTLSEMARIPIANPKKAMGFGGGKRKTSRSS